MAKNYGELCSLHMALALIEHIHGVSWHSMAVVRRFDAFVSFHMVPSCPKAV